MESLEGKKGLPRYKPPFPANFGLFGKPTTINNTETYASVPALRAASEAPKRPTCTTRSLRSYSRCTTWPADAHLQCVARRTQDNQQSTRLNTRQQAAPSMPPIA